MATFLINSFAPNCSTHNISILNARRCIISIWYKGKNVSESHLASINHRHHHHWQLSQSKKWAYTHQEFPLKNGNSPIKFVFTNHNYCIRNGIKGKPKIKVINKTPVMLIVKYLRLFLLNWKSWNKKDHKNKSSWPSSTCSIP